MRHSKCSGSIAVKLACACAAISLSAACLAAEQSPGKIADAPPVVASGDTSFAGLMDEAMVDMQHGMGSAPMTGDPDHDFAAMMIPHHRGAVDMAKAELLHGTNPILRRLAQEIIVTQGSEITVMQTELGKRSSRGPNHP